MNKIVYDTLVSGERTITLGKRQFNAQWNLMKFIRRGGSAQNEVLIETPNDAYTLIVIR